MYVLRWARHSSFVHAWASPRTGLSVLKPPLSIVDAVHHVGQENANRSGDGQFDLAFLLIDSVIRCIPSPRCVLALLRNVLVRHVQNHSGKEVWWSGGRRRSLCNMDCIDQGQLVVFVFFVVMNATVRPFLVIGLVRSINRSIDRSTLTTPMCFVPSLMRSSEK
jgi:hypothetical protein